MSFIVICSVVKYWVPSCGIESGRLSDSSMVESRYAWFELGVVTITVTIMRVLISALTLQPMIVVLGSITTYTSNTQTKHQNVV